MSTHKFVIVVAGSGLTTVLSGYATCTLTKGVITVIKLPGNNLFTGVPTVSVYGVGNNNIKSYNITTGGDSLYLSIKRLQLDANQEFKSTRIANGTVLY